MTIRRFDLESRGLARVLGDLEARILEAIWRLGQATVKEVTAELGEAHHKTVMTVMNRMVEKDLLTRHERGRSFVYAATQAREAFYAQIADRVLDGLLDDFGQASLAQFIDSISTEHLAELERLIAERRHQEER